MSSLKGPNTAKPLLAPRAQIFGTLSPEGRVYLDVARTH